MRELTAARLTDAVTAVCPNHGVSIGTFGVPESVRVFFRIEATQEQILAAAAVIEDFDWSDSAQEAWEADQNSDRKALRQAAAAAILGNTDYLNSSPTAAQVKQQVDRLTQQVNQIIRRLVQIE